jgi:Uma2 family endonuclease
VNAVHTRRFTPKEYLAWEEQEDTKHEYIRGEVYEVHRDAYGMVSARDAHVTVAGNVFALLKAHTRGTPCRTYIADMKLRVEAADAYFYPDVFVTCDPRDRESDKIKAHPVLIVEVLSDSTAAFDRGQKFATYRLLESLREYVVVDADLRTADVFRLDKDGHWVLYPYEDESEAEFASVGVRAPLEAIFEDVLPG